MTEEFDIVGFLETGAKTEADFRTSKLFIDPKSGKFIFPKGYIALLIQYKQVEIVPAYRDEKNVYHKKLYRLSSNPNESPDLEDAKVDVEESTMTDEDLAENELITIAEENKTKIISHSKTMLAKPEIPPQEETKYIGAKVTAFNATLDHNASDNKKVEKTELEKDQEFYDKIDINATQNTPNIEKQQSTDIGIYEKITTDEAALLGHDALIFVSVDEIKKSSNQKLLGLNSDLSTPDPSQQNPDAFLSKATIVDGGFVAPSVEVSRKIIEETAKIETKPSINVDTDSISSADVDILVDAREPNANKIIKGFESLGVPAKAVYLSSDSINVINDTPAMSPSMIADTVKTIKSFEPPKAEDSKKAIRDQITHLEEELKSAGMFKRGGIKKQIEELKAQL